MRTITVSTAVYARIWALREEGEEAEDAILRRVLNVQSPQEQPENSDAHIDVKSSDVGFFDAKYDVAFPAGFEIFRIYKGVVYRATAINGAWRLQNDGHLYHSLHKLSSAVVASRENSWQAWRYDAGGGHTAVIDQLRDPSKVVRRSRAATKLKLEDLSIVL